MASHLKALTDTGSSALSHRVSGRPRSLRDDEDAALAAYARGLIESGSPATRGLMQEEANRLRSRRDPPAAPVTKHWWQRWKARNPWVQTADSMHRPAATTEKYHPFNTKFNPEHVILPKGHAKETGRKRMLVACVLDRDQEIPLRDGLHAYADIFRPASSDETKVPAVICWSPYGKSSISVDNIWHRSGVPKDWTSGYETFEGLDPADWCRRGYAVVNVDARGCRFSEGTYSFWGEQEAQDIYDTIDFLSRQTWCNGSVCMGGSSYLAKAQVNFASKQSHPALKALAPWEGFTDIYRQLFRRGGFAMNNTFAARYQWAIAGNHDEVEDMAQMVTAHPLFDDYWADKDDDISKIGVPLYVLGSFNNPFHVQGSFDTFRRARSTKKWMRVHSSFAWYEMYEPNSNNDLQRFFDRFCKGIMNGWESDTPPLRLSLYGLGSIPNVVERPETTFPLARQRLETFYLDAATKSLHGSPREEESSTSHQSHGLEAPSSVSSATSTTEPAH